MKYKELVQLPDEELIKKVDEAELELMKLNAQVATGTAPKNPGQITKIRRTIARIKTVMTERAHQTQEVKQ